MPVLKPLRYLAQALAAQDSPRQLAAGLALGAVAGLIPKTSLLAHFVLIVLSASEANAAAGYVAAVIVTLVGPAFDLLLHPIGSFVLSLGALRPLWTWLYNRPIVPWTEFNNTVVMGAALVGAAGAYPLYRAAIPFCERYRDTIGAKIRRFKIAQFLLGADIVGKFK